VTYANGCIYEGFFDSERMKTGNSKYTWMTPGPEEGDEPIVSACYEGIYVEGKKAGYGKMTYPNGDVYTGEWKDNRCHGHGKLHLHNVLWRLNLMCCVLTNCTNYTSVRDARHIQVQDQWGHLLWQLGAWQESRTRSVSVWC
jgi:MORN repeat